jgi:FtsH-binding integral membrane protein
MTAAFVFLVQCSPATYKFVISPAGNGMALACCVISMVTMCAIVCCFGRTAPLNYVLLLVFTVAETYMVGGITAAYDSTTVMQAGAATALVTISLTVYAMKTKVPIEFFGALSFILCLAMLPLMLLSWIIGGTVISTVYCVCGALLYGIYLIIDTIMITGGKNNMSNVKCSMDDYIIGALMLYLDIVMLFIYILRILGNSKS